MRIVCLLGVTAFCLSAQTPSRRDFSDLRSRPARQPAYSPSRTTTAAPALIRLDELDWRFAPPHADLLAGINFSAIRDSRLARALIGQLARRQGLAESDAQRIFDALADVEQAGLCVSGGRMVMMMTGNLMAVTPPLASSGMGYRAITGGTALFGHEDAVAAAARRLTMNAAGSAGLMRAKTLAATYDFWLVSSGGLPGMGGGLPPGVKDIQVAVSLRDQLFVDIGLDLRPGADTRKLASAKPGRFGSVQQEGNTIHLRFAVPASEVESQFARMIAGPAGDALGQMVAAARNLPARPASAPPRSTRPVIVGLDSGPKEVGTAAK